MLDVGADQLYLDQGAVWVQGGTEPCLTLAELAEIGRREKGGPIIGQASYLAEFPPFDPSLAEGLTYPAFLAPSFSAHAARVRVDRDTGKVTVLQAGGRPRRGPGHQPPGGGRADRGRRGDGPRVTG